MAKGFPKVKKALNLDESVSEWHDSDDNSCVAVDMDDEAFSKAEDAILNSFQAFKH